MMMMMMYRYIRTLPVAKLPAARSAPGMVLAALGRCEGAVALPRAVVRGGDQRQGRRTSHRSPCGKHRLCYHMMALIISGCG